MTTKDQLSLRLIGLSDYRVVCDGRDIGRIRLADERPDMERWDWRVNPPLPIPSWQWKLAVARGGQGSVQDGMGAVL
jgi:hypothetical protein